MIKANICKHIHIVAAFIKENFANSLTQGNNVESQDANHSRGNLIEVENESAWLGNTIMKGISKKEVLSQDDMNNKKMKIWEKVGEILEAVTNDEHLNVFWNALLPIKPTIEACNSSVIPDFLPNSEGFKQVNCNKKISPQKNFYSTKKMRKHASVVMKPSLQEQVAIIANLSNREN